MRVLYLAPHINGKALSEPFIGFKWAEALSERVDLTVLTFRPHGHSDEAFAATLPRAEVVTWPRPNLPKAVSRIEALLKPTYPIYARHVRRWLRAALAQGRRFDIAHQILPQAARYGSPLRHFDLPYVIGPLGGALTTPEPFRRETASSSSAITALRGLDHIRFRRDPWLRASYSGAAAVLGVAPYVAEMLSDIAIQRFEPVLELGIDALPPMPDRAGRDAAGLRLLHVGRGVRTKGLRDAVRALTHLKDVPGLHLTSAGSGPEIALCRAEAESLGVADQVTFLGQVPRADLDRLYAEADIFLFPSFREPAGNVVYEAMSHGLPLIVADRGGPGFIVRPEFGRKVPVTEPTRFARDLAQAVREMAAARASFPAMGCAARATLTQEGLWPVKADRLVALYREILGA